ncbi:MAG: HAD family hydrolase [Clostridia bacterium]|nr:HAD family hydrolase [Clostridia bacterium]
MIYRYLLLDLDGTLLPMDTDSFIRKYLEAIAARLQPYLPPQEFIVHLLAATETMVRNKDLELTNEEVFMADFFRRSNLKPAEILPVFDSFYREDFPCLVCHTSPTSLAPQILAQALKCNLELIIATNPVFPRIAIEERMRWAGVDNFPFRLVTTYENMHFCKPLQEYYSEILAYLGAQPEHCLMVGNDVEEDMIAAELGIHTYLVDDYLINRSGRPVQSHYQGSLEDFLAFLRGMSDSL